MRCLLVALVLFMLFPTLGYGADATRDAAPSATFTNAGDVYLAKYLSSPPGVYKDGEVIFVIAEVSIKGISGNRDQQRAMAVFAAWDELRDYAARLYKPSDMPEPPALIGAFPELLPILQTEDPDIGRFALKYNGKTRVLANTVKDGIYRHVIVLPCDEFEDALPSTNPAKMQAFQMEEETRVLAAWRNAWARYAEKSELPKLRAIVPLPEDELRAAGEELRQRLNADSLCWGPVSPGVLYAAWTRVEALGGALSLESLAAAAADAPVPASALTAWADTPEASPWGALDARLLALADENVREAALNSLSRPGEGSSGEYASWLSTLATAQAWPDLAMDATPGPVASAAWRTLGHANFPDRAPIAETTEYLEAKRLFDAGRDLPRLTGLLLQSVEVSPCHAASWALLGDALRASGALEDAAWASTQALRLSPRNADTRTSLALIYQAAGRLEWAAGMAASALAQSHTSAWSRSEATKIMEDYRNRLEKP